MHSLFARVENFLKLFERNQDHMFFKWLNDLPKEYSGTLNAQFDPQNEHVLVSERTSPSTRKEIQQQNFFNAKVSQEAQRNSLVLDDRTQSIKQSQTLFSKRELAELHKFFHEKLVIKADLKDSLKVLSDLFKEMKLPPLLERRVIESFLYASETVSE